MNLSVTTAVEADARAIAALQIAVADHLTSLHGKGHWSYQPSEAGILRAIKTSQALVARDGDDIIGTLYLATKKPWAIDVKYFSAVKRAIYLTSMAVAPDFQGRGVGRYMLEEAKAVTREWPGQAIRLDAYDAVAGAGGFYVKCGYRRAGLQMAHYYEKKTPAPATNGQL